MACLWAASAASTSSFAWHTMRAASLWRPHAAKARGTKLGNPDMDRVRGLGVVAIKVEADRHAATVRPIIENIQARGAKSLRAIAAELTRMRVPTARGGTEWSAQQVSNILKRTM